MEATKTSTLTDQMDRNSSSISMAFGDPNDEEVMNYSCEVYNDPSFLSNNRFDATFKLILIGDSGVGKSCIIKRMGNNTFNDDHEVTIGAEFTTVAAQINKR